MSPITSPRTVRLRRLYRHGPNGLLVTPLDHTLACGPVTRPGWSLDDLIAALVAGGSDAVVLHKGAVRLARPEHLSTVSVIVHLNGSTGTAGDPDAKVLLTTVDEAIRLGADAVSVHVNLGSATEGRQLQDLARAATACDRWNLPLLVMIYPRGPMVRDPKDPDLLLRAVTIAADLGADLVKTTAPRNQQTMQMLTQRCPIPVLFAGGPPRNNESDLFAEAHQMMGSGAGGLALGRSLFCATDPRRTTAEVAAIVHQKPGLLHNPATTQKGMNHVDRQPAVLA